VPAFTREKARRVLAEGTYCRGLPPVRFSKEVFRMMGTKEGAASKQSYIAPCSERGSPGKWEFDHMGG